MTIDRDITGSTLTLAIGGRIDGVTAPELDYYLKKELDGVTDLVLDLKDLEYASSAGLRVLLKANKKIHKRGSMKVINVNSDVYDLLELTGFTKIMTVVPS